MLTTRAPGGCIVKKIVLTLLVIPLIIVMATKDPQAVGRLVVVIITVGAKLLSFVATLLNVLLGGNPK